MVLINKVILSGGLDKAMKAYLDGFFKRFDYSEEDSAFLMGAYDKIIKNAETKNIWEKSISIYDESIDCDYKEILMLADDVASKLYLHEYTVELLIFICLSKRTQKIYEERGIPDEIFYNSMLDLKYKTDECKIVKGIVGSFVAEWFVGFFNLTRFALGRLQFEIKDFEEHYEKNGKRLTPESKVINIHIPRTLTPLDEESCNDAFQMAKLFFEKEIGPACAFVCYSWLLYPENKKILSENSNVYRFMSKFDLIKSGISKNGDDLWRIFDTDERNCNRLPVNTSMRKAYVNHLKNGGKTGWGYGVFFYDER